VLGAVWPLGWAEDRFDLDEDLILSPTTTPPPSMGMLVVMPKSWRLISVVAENPARVPPKGSRENHEPTRPGR